MHTPENPRVWSLFLDASRESPTDNYYDVCRTIHTAMKCTVQYGPPTFISLDPDHEDALNYLVYLRERYKSPPVTVYTHSKSTNTKTIKKYVKEWCKSTY